MADEKKYRYFSTTTLKSFVSDIKAKVVAMIPTKTSQLTNDSNFLTSHQSLSGYVPTSRTVNSKALSSDITLDADDVGAGLPPLFVDYTDILQGNYTFNSLYSLVNEKKRNIIIVLGNNYYSLVKVTSTEMAWNNCSDLEGVITSRSIDWIGADATPSTSMEEANTCIATDTLTIATTAWDSTALTATITTSFSSRFSGTPVFIISPAPDSMADYINAGVKCTEEATKSLTFSCETIPTSALTINVVALA